MSAKLEIPVYRPEITVYHREPDGEWDTTNGTHTATLFYPMDDFDGLTEAGFLKVVREGSEPFHLILAPHGCEMVHKGRAVYLRTADGKLHDALDAVVLAKRRDHGLSLARPGSPRVVAAPAPIKPSGRTLQLSMFGDEPGSEVAP